MNPPADLRCSPSKRHLPAPPSFRFGCQLLLWSFTWAPAGGSCRPGAEENDHNNNGKQKRKAGGAGRWRFDGLHRRSAGGFIGFGLLFLRLAGAFEGVVDQTHTSIFPSNSRMARPTMG